MNRILHVGHLTHSSANAISVPVSAAATHLANHSLGWGGVILKQHFQSVVLGILQLKKELDIQG